jgi:poly(3-hydroxybutyrate) depolymerase
MRSRLRSLRWAPILALVAGLSLLVPNEHATAAGALYRAPEVSGSLARHDISGVYVSGVSSGAYMAGQLQVAYSGRIQGSALFGSGPYYCAQNNVDQALYGCMDDVYPTYLPTLENDAATWSSYGWIDPVGGLDGRPVYVYHGRNDTTVRASVSDDGVAFWRHFGARVTYDDTSSAGHAWVTPYGVNGCSVTASPYLNDCGTDPERALLATVFGSVSAPNTGPLTGTLVRFPQSDYAVNGSAASLSMGGSGFAYVPAACDTGSCRLMVALHGCKQGYDAIGRTFVDRAGLNQYADTNRMIVLYPQATASGVNPDGCWDWWGYLGATNYPIHGGYQVETIMNMVSALGG